jgi:ubiquinone/menaquinone biosynthesis C-methylase UbiE
VHVGILETSAELTAGGGTTMAGDIYTRLNDLDQDALAFLAQMLERRGSHPQQVAIRAAYLNALGDLSGLQVLEVGCGTGVVTRDLARRVGPLGHVVGIDPSPALIDVARRLAADHASNMTFKVEDGRDLQMGDGLFDVTCAVTVLSHVPEREGVLREMVRVTRPGGRVLIVDGDFAAIQLEHPDRSLTTRTVDAWRATTVDDPYLTRRLGPMVTAAGLTTRSVSGHIHVEAGRVDSDTSFILAWTQFAARQASAAGAVTQAEADGWIADVAEMNERHLLFGSMTFIGMVCDRP